MVEISSLKILTVAEEAAYRIRGLPEHPAISDPGGQFFGHEWAGRMA